MLMILPEEINKWSTGYWISYRDFKLQRGHLWIFINRSKSIIMYENERIQKERNNMSFVVFLDVDGVLNTRTTCERAPSEQYTGIDELRIRILAGAMRECRASGVVLTTTWKNLRPDHEDYIYLKEGPSYSQISAIMPVLASQLLQLLLSALGYGSSCCYRTLR